MPFQDKPYQSCCTTRKLLQQHDYKSATNFDVTKYGPNRGAQKKKKKVWRYEENSRSGSL